MARIEKLKNVTIATGRKLYREHTIQQNTKAMLDARSVWAGAAKNVKGGDVIKDLTYNDNHFAVQNTNVTLQYVANSLKFPIQAGQRARIDLPADGIPKWADDEWVINLWVAPEQYVSAGSTTNCIFTIGNMGGWAFVNALCALNITTAVDSLTVPTFLRFAVRSVGFDVNDAESLSLFTASPSLKPVLVSIHCKVGATQTTASIYLNNKLKATRTTNNATTPIANNTNCLNSPDISHYSTHIAGRYCRYRFDKIASGGISASDLIALEYSEYKDIFV